MTVPSSIASIAPAELKALRDAHADITLIDVRESDELAVCSLADALHIPLGSVPLRHHEIPADKPVILYCHHGRRSLQAAQYLQTKGFTDLSNLTGGIHAWATQIDPEMATY